MDKQYWQQRWQRNEIGFNQSQPNLLMQRYFPRLNLKSGARVLVPLCGKSIDMIWLAGQGYKVSGIELSDEACKTFFSENRMRYKVSEMNDLVIYSTEEITLFAGDFFSIPKNLLNKIDAVYDRAALIALPHELRELYSQQLAKLLEPHSKIFLITTRYDPKEMQGPPFSVNEKEIDELYKDNFTIIKSYTKEIGNIPEHLKIQGLKCAVEEVFILIKKNN